MLLQVAHLYMGCTPLAQGCPLLTSVLLKTQHFPLLSFLIVSPDLVILELGGRHPGPAEAALHQPGRALLSHVLLVLGPGYRLVTGLAQGDVPGAVDYVKLVASSGDSAPTEKIIRKSVSEELESVLIKYCCGHQGYF